MEQTEISPESNAADKIAHVKGLIDDDRDTDNPSSYENEASGDVGGPDSGSGELDSQELDAASSLEEATEGDSPEDPGEDTRSDIELLAERLEIEQADVYGLEVPLKEGGSVTLSELKDAYQEYGPIKEARAETQKIRDEHERQVLQTRTELNAIMAVIPEATRAEIIRQARERNKAWESQQESTVLEAIPEWSDPDKRAEDRKAIVDLGAEYAFTESEMTFTQDARTLRLLRDMARMKAELAGMKTAAKREPGKQEGKSKLRTQSKNKALRDALGRFKSDPTPTHKAQAVAHLLRQ